jgi:hypothetical protein
MLRLGYSEADGSAFGAGGAIFGAAAGAGAGAATGALPPQAPHASQTAGAGEAQDVQQHFLQTNKPLITFNTLRIG